MHVIGLDIGGANLKAAHSDGSCRTRPFPIWQRPDDLESELRKLISDWLPCRAMAVTMTAELADCFETKAEGVQRIVSSVEQLAHGDSVQSPTPVLFWQTSGEFVAPDIAVEFPLLTAAANWHALATFIGRIEPEGNSLLIDVGSTTCDIIPMEDGIPMPTGRTDAERLLSGELVYSGVERTPVCAIAYSVPMGDQYSQVAAELFATTRDVYLLLDDIPEEADDTNTANGKPATHSAAHDRLARQFCQDRFEFDQETAQRVAQFFADVQQQRITGAIDRVLKSMNGPCQSVMISGAGAFLAERIVGAHKLLGQLERHSLNKMFSPETATSACAFALAKLGAEKIVAVVE
jgi:(4-(4-[2-(gamma-L-glutamylamino)ethyl]phenoxymethyl)furan-2-yl)methanamine synthase